MVPLTIILKALQPDCSDRDVYAQMIGGSKSGVGTIIAPQIEGYIPALLQARSLDFLLLQV